MVAYKLNKCAFVIERKRKIMWAYPEIDPVAFSIGPLVIRWYALAYLAGFLIGWRYCMHIAGFDEGKRPNAKDIDDFLPWAIVGVILGGRLGYVLFYQADYYFANPGEIYKLWHGGMSFHGGTLGVIASMILYSWRQKISLLRLADFVAACAPIGLFFGRLANFINGELYGRVTQSSWGMVFPHAGEEPRHPSQLYEAFLEGLVLFILLAVAVRIKAVRDRQGMVAGLFLIGYGVFRSVVELFREPDAYLGLFWGSISMGQILSLPMALAGVALCVFACVYKNARCEAHSGMAVKDAE